jgi:hypothetical protein
MSPDSVFLDFNLPNATSWFYFSGLLAVALFFKFRRLLSVRNWDVLSMYILVPGLLLLLEARIKPGQPSWYGQPGWFGYLALLIGSAYLLVRCFFDLALVSRPALAPNLNLSGLAWLAGALFVSLVAVAVRQSGEGAEPTGKAPALIEHFRDQGENVVAKQGVVQNGAVFVDRGLAVGCHLLIAIGLVVIGYRHFQDTHAGMAAATFYMLLPYVYMLMPYSSLGIGHWGQVWPMAVMVWAIAAYRMPTVSGGLLGLATGTAYFPLLVFPLWVGFYRGRGRGRFAVSFTVTLGLCIGAIVGVLLYNGELPGNVQRALSLPDWQAWREPGAGMNGFWTGVHWAYRMPVFIAFAAIVMATAFWPSPKNLAHLLALSAAILLGIQFWYADQGGVYVLWYLPFLLLMVFRPNLSDRQPLPIQAENDWLVRLGRLIASLHGRLLKRPETLALKK